MKSTLAAFLKHVVMDFDTVGRPSCSANSMTSTALGARDTHPQRQTFLALRARTVSCCIPDRVNSPGLVPAVPSGGIDQPDR